MEAHRQMTWATALMNGGGFLIYCYAHYLLAWVVLRGVQRVGRKIKGIRNDNA